MTSYFLFSLNGARYGVETQAVLEIAWLPELSPAGDAPAYIAGVVNLRGKIAPVMNLAQRLGHPHGGYRLSDCIVMLQADGAITGMVVSEVSDVLTISESQIDPLPRYDGAAPVHFLAGNARLGDEIIMLLDVVQLLHAQALSGMLPAPDACFCPGATDEERAVFHARAHNLMQTEVSSESAGQIALAIIELGGEYFGVGLEAVREFSHLRRVTLVPCCPPHIAGNMNLRGDILTLVDIRGLLNIQASGAAAEVMVVEFDALSTGIQVDQVLEVIYLNPADIASPVAAVHEGRNEYCKGVARYGTSMVSILDMKKILTQGGLEVEEQA
ncbi:MAG: chemotaxis protein CheW [Gallionella sp.]|nr:chemotaxis protein CheW [Gallionella sp.]